VKFWRTAGAILSFASACLLLIASPARAERRAFLVGIASYQNVESLKNPRNDVEMVAQKLTANGYITTLVPETSTTRANLITQFSIFLDTIEVNDEIVVYYSGHGIDLRGDNMMVPSDSPKPDRNLGEYALQQTMISFRSWIQEIEDRNAAVQIWIIDACRTNPYEASGKPFVTSGGLASMEDMPTNTFVLMSAKYGQVARDTLLGERLGDKLGSPFSRTFVGLFDAWKSQSIQQYSEEVRREVSRLVHPDPQFASIKNEILEQWCFVTCSKPVDVGLVAARRQQVANQLSYLYRPLNLKMKQGDVKWLEFTARFRHQFGRSLPFKFTTKTDGDGKPMSMPLPLTDAEWAFWLSEVRTSLKPHNDFIEQLIDQNSAFAEDEDVNGCFREFFLYKAAFDAALNKAENDSTLRIWGVDHSWPGCLVPKVESRVNELAAREASFEARKIIIGIANSIPRDTAISELENVLEPEFEVDDTAIGESWRQQARRAAAKQPAAFIAHLHMLRDWSRETGLSAAEKLSRDQSAEEQLFTGLIELDAATPKIPLLLYSSSFSNQTSRTSCVVLRAAAIRAAHAGIGTESGNIAIASGARLLEWSESRIHDDVERELLVRTVRLLVGTIVLRTSTFTVRVAGLPLPCSAILRD
jgi:Caspase domain